ncbi:MAG: magnesium transporter [Ruminococcaceae bacterium]|nr:magnesium transporter [Oscillospiraceae bacterium]
MPEFTATIETALESLLEQKKYNTIKDLLTTMNPSDIAFLFEDMAEYQQRLALLFRLLPKQLAAEVFVELEVETQELLITGFSDRELHDIINEMYVDDAVDLVEEMPAGVVKRILSQADPETRRTINEFLKYPEDSAGSIMTTEYVDLSEDLTAGGAIEHIRETGLDKETVNVCYVIDNRRKLIGAVSIRSIILARPDALIGDIMEDNVISVATHEDQEEVAQMFARYNFTVLPVVDKEQRLIGIVTVDDAIDVIQEEATEDMAKMAAMSHSDKPYMRLTTFEIWKSRIPWLMLLMLSSTFTQMIISGFEDALSACIALTGFIPMLMGTGGNSGSQASVTIIRGLSLKEIELSDVFRILWKELRVSLLCGLSLCVVNFAKLMIFDQLGVAVALVVSGALLATIIVAKLVGCVLPLLAEKLGFDPAVMASPFITTIVDALSLLIYFALAVMVLGI